MLRSSNANVHALSGADMTLLVSCLLHARANGAVTGSAVSVPTLLRASADRLLCKLPLVSGRIDQICVAKRLNRLSAKRLGCHCTQCSSGS